MSRKILVTGTLEADSAHGKAVIEGTSDLLKISFPDSKSLASVADYQTLKRLRSHAGAFNFFEQDIVFTVGNAVWITVEKGKLKIKSPVSTALFYIRQWMKR